MAAVDEVVGLVVWLVDAEIGRERWFGTLVVVVRVRFFEWFKFWREKKRKENSGVRGRERINMDRPKYD